MGTNEHICANFSCDADHPLHYVVQNTELLRNFVHAGAQGVRKCFPCISWYELSGSISEGNFLTS